MTLPFPCFLTSCKRGGEGKKLKKSGLYYEATGEKHTVLHCMWSSLGPCDRYLELSSPRDVAALGTGEF